MRLANPGEIICIYFEKGFRMPKVSFNGVLKSISVEWTPEVKEGDFVIVHAGSALTVLNADEAEETIETLRQIESQ